MKFCCYFEDNQKVPINNVISRSNYFFFFSINFPFFHVGLVWLKDIPLLKLNLLANCCTLDYRKDIKTLKDSMPAAKEY
jgi:hypothetical protein